MPFISHRKKMFYPIYLYGMSEIHIGLLQILKVEKRVRCVKHLSCDGYHSWQGHCVRLWVCLYVCLHEWIHRLKKREKICQSAFNSLLDTCQWFPERGSLLSAVIDGQKFRRRVASACIFGLLFSIYFDVWVMLWESIGVSFINIIQ